MSSKFNIKSDDYESKKEKKIIAYCAACFWSTVEHVYAHLYNFGFHFPDAREDIGMQRVCPRRQSVDFSD